MLHRNVPLAQQVANEVLSGIVAGTLGGSEGLLPTEAELSERFRVSRATVRDALSRLEQRGVIVRRHGIGTFVASSHPLMEAGLEELESVFTLANRIGLELHIGALTIEEREASLGEQQSLKTPAGTTILSVERVMMTGDRPIAYFMDVVPTCFLRREDLNETFNGSILDLFLKRSNLPLKHSYTELTAELAHATIAAKLQLRRGDPLLKLEAQLYAKDGCVVDSSLSYFVPGYLRFHVIRRVHQVGA
jgi:GntR family transcriptional regulator